MQHVKNATWNRPNTSFAKLLDPIAMSYFLEYLSQDVIVIAIINV